MNQGIHQWTIIMLVRSHTGPILKSVWIREDCRKREALALAATHINPVATPIIESVAIPGIHIFTTFHLQGGNWTQIKGRRL